MLKVRHMLNWGLRLQADVSQQSCNTTAMIPSSWTTFAPQQHKDTSKCHGPEWPPSTWRWYESQEAAQIMSALPRKAPFQCDILTVFSCSHFLPISHFCFIPFFLLLLPECTSRVPCHGNTCRWRQSSSSAGFASAEEVTNHSTSREVLSPRYPGTICKRGCPWSTRFSQVFRLLLQTSGKALFPLFASHHIPCLCYFTQSCKLTA